MVSLEAGGGARSMNIAIGGWIRGDDFGEIEGWFVEMDSLGREEADGLERSTKGISEWGPRDISS